MPKRMSLSVPPTAELASFMAEWVGSGRFGSSGEVIRMDMRSLAQKEKPFPSRRTKLGCGGVRDDR